MRVFVAGATGVLGRRVVARLVGAGHDVTGVSRSTEKDAMLASLGARPVRVDLFDADALRVAAAGADAVVNVATKIPPIVQMNRMSAWGENERIRREASANLVDAAIAGGATVFVQESLAFMYGDHGDAWVDAGSTPLTSSVFSDAIEAAEENVARFTAQGGRGVVLRFGRFYAPDSDYATAMVQAARRGLVLDVGGADTYAPMIDADDAATAVVAALDAPAGTYDIVDDDPLTRADQSAALAAAVGRRRLWRAPRWAAPSKASYLTASQRVSNQAFRVGHDLATVVDRRAGRVPQARPGAPDRVGAAGAGATDAVGARRERLRCRGASRVLPALVLRRLPLRSGLGRDGRALQRAPDPRRRCPQSRALVLTIGAIVVGTRAITRITAASWFVYSVPHLVYHLRHLTMAMPGADKVGIVVSLSIPVAAAIVMLFDRAELPPAAIAGHPPVARTAPTNLTQVSARR